MATAAEKERAKKGIRARQDAIKFILEKYADEFQVKLEENRLALGLPRRANAEPPEVLERKLHDAEERAERLRRDLELAQQDAKR